MKRTLLTQRSQLYKLLRSLTQNPLNIQLYAPIFQLFTAQNPKSLFHKLGQQTHAQFLLNGLNLNAFVAAKLLAMYASLDDLNSGILVFDRVSFQSPLLYNSIIRAYTLYGEYEKTLERYVRMVRKVNADGFTYPFVLKSCSELLAFGFGKCVHGQCLRHGWASDTFVGTSLIDMYVKCNVLGDARLMFDELCARDVTSWNSLITGYMKDGLIRVAEELFEKMPESEKNVITWTVMISGYTQNGLGEQALRLFNEMIVSGSEKKPGWVTIVSVLPACAQSAALEQGKRIHKIAKDLGFESNLKVQVALAAMYAKCGSLSDACTCINKIDTSKRPLVAWNILISAYASHGYGAEAVLTFKDMVRLGVQPDSISFVGLLSGCSHSGLVDSGLKHFHTMSAVYSVEPRNEHYACVVDLLSRIGRLSEAKNFIDQMPIKAGASIWGALLFGCRKYRNLEIAEISARELRVLEPDNCGNYVILSNMYAAAGMWVEVDKLRGLLKSKGMKKSPGSCWIEINRKSHMFLGGDTRHPNSKEIYSFLEKLPQTIKEAGYTPDTSFALHDVTEEEKESSLNAHSERLAVAFGILNTSPETVLRVTKNLRICGDCHTMMKFISKIYNREIIVRDVNRFHHFRDGSCSCGEFW